MIRVTKVQKVMPSEHMKTSSIQDELFSIKCWLSWTTMTYWLLKTQNYSFYYILNQCWIQYTLHGSQYVSKQIQTYFLQVTSLESNFWLYKPGSLELYVRMYTYLQRMWKFLSNTSTFLMSEQPPHWWFILSVGKDSLIWEQGGVPGEWLTCEVITKENQPAKSKKPIQRTNLSFRNKPDVSKSLSASDLKLKISGTD